MIDAGIFKNEWAILEERFDQEHSRAYANRVYEILNDAGLETDEFQHACKVIFRRYPWEDDQPYRFPRAEDFIGPALRYRKVKRFQKIRKEIEAQNEREIERLTAQARKALPPGESPSDVLEKVKEGGLVEEVDDGR